MLKVESLGEAWVVKGKRRRWERADDAQGREEV